MKNDHDVRTRAELRRREISDDFTEIVGSSLNFYEKADKVDLTACDYQTILELQKGWDVRYRNDAKFHAKVDTIVYRLMGTIYP